MTSQQPVLQATSAPRALSLPAGVGEEGAVEVWCLALARRAGEAAAAPAGGTTGASEARDRADGVAQLSPEEIERSGRISSDGDRWRYLESRVWLRQLLAARLAVAPVEVSYRQSATGKPELAHAGPERVRFNLSRSGELVLYVISSGRDVGIDVQECVAGVDLRRLGRRFLSGAEKEVLAALEDRERRRAFYRTWVRKEAFLKAVGVGLAAPWSAVDTSLDLVRIDRELSGLSLPAGGADQWSVHDLSLGSGSGSGSGSGGGSAPGSLDGASAYVAALSVKGAPGTGAPNRASRTSPAVSIPRATELPQCRG